MHQANTFSKSVLLLYWLGRVTHFQEFGVTLLVELGEPISQSLVVHCWQKHAHCIKQPIFIRGPIFPASGVRVAYRQESRFASRCEIQFEWFVSIIVAYQSKYKHHIIVSFDLIYQLTS